MNRIALRSLALILVAVAGCNAPGATATDGNPADGNSLEMALVGSDQIQLFDATAFNQQPQNSASVVSAIVTINEIDAKIDGPGGKDIWVPIMKSAVVVDLLKLDNVTINKLGITTLPSVHIEALRLVLDEIGDYVVLKDGTKKPLEVPDNGIVQIDGKLDLDACPAGIIILDFDPHIKVEREPSRKEYELTCTAHIKTEEIKHSCAGDMGHGAPDMTPPQQCSATMPCGSGDICQAGVCVADPCTGVFCPGGQICQSGACVPDPCNGVFCTGTQVCVAGVCK